MTVTADIAAALREAGVDGWLHAVDLAGGAQVEYGSDEPVVLASVFKVPVLVTLFRAFDDGELDPAKRMDVAVAGRSDGPTGLSVMADPIELSLRDLAYWMMSVSDNAATDVLVRVVGTEAIRATLDRFGLAATRVDGTCHDLYETFAADLPAGVEDATAEQLAACRAVDPLRTLHAGTPRDVTRLLAAIWADEAAAPGSCKEMRRILGAQAWPHRLRTGFTETDTSVSAKTGTLPFVRNEAGVVEDGHGGRHAVAVFLRSPSPAYRLPAADRVIGTVARIAVDALRPAALRAGRPGVSRRTPYAVSDGDVEQRIRVEAADAGTRIWLHARDLDGTAAIGVDETEQVVTASVFKVPVAVELARQSVAGEIDLSERVLVTDDDHVPSLVGVDYHRDPVLVSYRDLAFLMLTMSDNLATDLVLARVGKDRVAERLAELGLTGTAVVEDCREILGSVSEDLGIAYGDDGVEPSAAFPVERLAALRALDPARTCRTTAAEITALLAGVWRDEAAPPSACALVRGWMGHQIWPHRLTSGFPDDDVKVSGKTGTLPFVRNEVGVVEGRGGGVRKTQGRGGGVREKEYPDGGRYAVGVFTRAFDAAPNVPRLDDLVGWAAAAAVTHLRSTR